MNVLETKSKQALTKDLEDLIYDTQLKDIGIYSKQYFYSIIYSMYQDIPNKENFCFTYGDFNGLGNINSIHGKDAGDIAVEEALKIIKQTMPKGTLICRIAGDEFAFLTPGYTKEKIAPYIQKVHENLKKANTKKTKELSITLASMDNHIYSNFDDLYTHSELDVTNQKRKSNEQVSKDPNNVLREKSKASLSRFFDYYRFDDSTLPDNFFVNLKNILLDMLCEMKNKQNNLQNSQLNLYQNLTIKSISSTAQKHKQATAANIHTILTASNSDSKKLLSQVPEESLSSLYDYLIRHPLTHQYSKKYFERILGPDIVNGPRKKLAIHHFDILHMKLSNDLVGHENTDIKMCELLNHIIKPISEKNKNAQFVTRGGTLLLIEDADNATPKDKILQYITAAQKNQKHLNLAYESTICDSKALFEEITNLENKCAIQKRKIKAKKIVDYETMTEALNTALKDPINYYLKSFENPTSLQSLQKFFNTLFQSLVDVIVKKQKTEHIFKNLRPSAFDERPKQKTEKSLDD